MKSVKAVLASVGVEVPSQLFAEDLTVGMTHTAEVLVTREMITSFAKITGDHNIFHIRESGRCFAHGRLLGDLAATVISNWLGGTQRGFPVLSDDSTNYVGMVPAGSSLKITVSVKGLFSRNTKRSIVFLGITGVCDRREVITGSGNVLVPYRNRG